MSSNTTDEVFIKDLTVTMSVGIYEHERKAKQRVIIGVSMKVESNRDKTPENVTDVVSYEDVIKEIEKLSCSKHFDLLEEFTEEISEICLRYDKVLVVTVRTEKPDIMPQANSVGIEITRDKRP